MTDLKAIAKILDDAALTATATPQLSTLGFDLDLQQAYDIQKLSMARRVERGQHIVGIKMGFTSRAKMIQMGLNEMIWGHLTNSMLVADGGTINYENYVHPRVEPEIAFLLKKPLQGIVSPMEALSAVEAVAPALEIIDSRYENFKFNLMDVIADNSSSSAYVVGPWVSPKTSLENLGMVMYFNGEPVQIGSSAAILGHPLRALAGASKLASDYKQPLQQGWTVMSGAGTIAEALSKDIHVKLEVENMGSVSFSVN